MLRDELKRRFDEGDTYVNTRQVRGGREEWRSRGESHVILLLPWIPTEFNDQRNRYLDIDLLLSQTCTMSLLARLPIEPFRPITLHLGRGCKFTTCATLCTDKKAYSHTLNLPKTSVPLKLKSPAATEKALRHNLSDDLYQWQVS